MHSPNTLARAVASARESAGLLKSQLADMAGVSRSSITRIEAGEITRPDAVTLARIARALGVSVDSLLCPPARRRNRRRAA